MFDIRKVQANARDLKLNKTHPLHNADKVLSLGEKLHTIKIQKHFSRVTRIKC
jgi:hypothetical protein